MNEQISFAGLAIACFLLMLIRIWDFWRSLSRSKPKADSLDYSIDCVEVKPGIYEIRIRLYDHYRVINDGRP